MKKVLYGTSALVAAGLLFSGSALAADPISISIGGTFAAAAGYVSQDDGVGQVANRVRNHGFAQSSEIIFKGSTELDNGVKVAVVIELEGESGGNFNQFGDDQIDENFIRFSSDAWGTLELGGRDGAASKMLTLGPAVDFNHIVGAAEFSYITFPGAAAGQLAGAPLPVGRGSDSTKITYYTPDMSGFQFGISYEPENGLDGQTSRSSTTSIESSAANAGTAGRNSEFVDLGIRYVTTLGDVSFRGSVLYSTGSQEVSPAAGEFLTDFSLWNVGVQLGFGAFSVGGAYDVQTTAQDAFATREGDRVQWRIATSYSTGPWVVGAAFARNEVDDDVAIVGGTDQTSVWGVTVKRTLGPGVTISAGVRVWDIEDDDNVIAAENSATNIFFSTRLDF